MTLYYKTNTWSSQPNQLSQDQIDWWKHLSEKKNWRIVQLPNEFYET